MSDQIDALERLAKLREQGCLTDEEFKAEKAKLLNGGGKPTRKSLAEAWEETADQRRSMWGNLKWQLGALFVLAPVLGYAGWTQLHKMTPEQATKIIGERLPQCASEDVRKALRGAIEVRNYIREAGTQALTSRDVLRCELDIVLAARDGRHCHAPLNPNHACSEFSG